MIRVQAVVVRIVYRRKLADQGIIPNFYALECYHGGALINEDPVANLKASPWLCAQLATQQGAAHGKPLANLDISVRVQHRKVSLT